MIKLYSPEECNKIFSELISELENEYNPDIINKKISNTFGEHFAFSNSFGDENRDDFRVYRFIAEHPNLKENPNDITNYSYNPKPPLGRANLENEPVFYCSFEPHTAIEETKKLSDKNYYISTWKIKKEFNAFLLVYDSVERNDFLAKIIDDNLATHFKSLGKKANWYRHQQKKITDLFTFNGNRFYNISSAIAHNLLYTSKEQGIDIPILIYPSVSKNHTEYNFAIHPSYVNNPDLFELVSVVKCNIKQTENGLEGDILSKAIAKDKKLIWGYTNIKIQRIDYKKSELAIDGYKNWIQANAKKVKIQFYNNEYFLKDYLDKNLNKLIQPDEVINWNEFDIYNSKNQYIQEKKIIIKLKPHFKTIDFNYKDLQYVAIPIKFLLEFIQK